ncbi:pleckstrin homology domain-containing family M member 1 [Synchiropus picturatus]
MLATQSSDAAQEAQDVKQIKEKLVQSLKALQKRYVTSDAVVTSEDSDANLLCSALEAVFIHGLKSKYIRVVAGGRSRKGGRGPLPQPFFWALLKTVTHRDVITELEKLNFVGTDVGRCRAWLRLALNHGLLECYLISLFRENSKLRSHYQPSAFLLNSEEREVLLSYLQGLASLTFNLSYKSAVLNEWTTTPLALAGLCPLSQADIAELPVNGTSKPASKPAPRESWDTVSQSSGSSDALDLLRGPVEVKANGFPDQRSALNSSALNSSNLSLDTTGSSQLSSSLSSDSFLQGPDPRSLSGEQWQLCDPDTNPMSRKQKDSPSECRESGHCSQDSMRDDSLVSSTGADQFSETAIFSGSDSDTQVPPSPTNVLPNSVICDIDPATPPPPSDDTSLSCQHHADDTPPDVSLGTGSEQLLDSETQSTDDPLEPVESGEEGLTITIQVEETKVEDQEENPLDSSELVGDRSLSIRSTDHSSDSLTHSRSWISEDDIYKPHLDVPSDHEEVPAPPPAVVPSVSLSTPSVVHRRQMGLSNPFRGLLKLGHLERRGAMGMWRDVYCELSPFEFRVYLNAEERTCCDNCYLVRCEDVRLSSSDGRFELLFPGKRLSLRAANLGEAEDWVDRIVEAIGKCRPMSQVDEQWEVLHVSQENDVEEHIVSSSSSAACSPEKNPSDTKILDRTPPHTQEFEWTRTVDPEADAIKESVLYISTDMEARTWVRFVFSLSLETLKGFRVQEGKKLLRLTHPIEEVRDVVPDVALGGADFFKILTVRETLRLKAENPEEARSWRVLIRGALDSYLECGVDDVGSEEQVPVGNGLSGNLYRLVQHRLKENGALLAHLCTVPSEKGLDSQNFKCAGCPQQIGPSMGRARLCEFSGRYYCECCHHGDTSIIPSRMVHNWDLKQREVCKKAMWLLDQVKHEPLINMELLNPDLVQHSESMSHIHTLRKRLRLLGDYLLTCRSGACKTLQAKMEQRTYLLESSHLYSVMDLRQIVRDQYATYLLTLLQCASNHVFNCDLCTQRGFICQICHANDIIFPFQFDITTRCKDCKAVFHLACKTRGHSCPRCLRMKKYQERSLMS